MMIKTLFTQTDVLRLQYIWIFMYISIFNSASSLFFTDSFIPVDMSFLTSLGWTSKNQKHILVEQILGLKQHGTKLFSFKNYIIPLTCLSRFSLAINKHYRFLFLQWVVLQNGKTEKLRDYCR